MEEEELNQRSFHLCQRHISFLEEINPSRSQALRTVLDSIITGEEQTQRKKILDNSILYISLGFVFFCFIFLTQNIYIYIIGLGLGLFLITYGSIGGLRNALQRTNGHQRKQ